MKQERIKKISSTSKPDGNIIYWMSRDQRVFDNWSLVFVIELAEKLKKKFSVVFTLVPDFLEATLRQYQFMLQGLNEVYGKLKNLNINFQLLIGDPVEELSKYILMNNISGVITDFDPLKIKKEWQSKVIKSNNVDFYIVDSHNIVPVWVTSEKLEFAAYTIRPKIKKKLNEFLDDFPKINRLPDEMKLGIDYFSEKDALESLNVNKNVKMVNWIRPGEDEAKKTLKDFINNKLEFYAEKRNLPDEDYQSNLSPYLHFGHISAQRIVMETTGIATNIKSLEAFHEELIIRRELSDNYCYYNNNYDNQEGFPEWARNSLSLHEKDKREYIYDIDAFEAAETHDELWNAAQNEMVLTGKMHGYMRMYWAKKILEWTKSVDIAQEIAIYLNDKYEIDGRDPNGYTGIAWSIGGVHDRPWFEREVYGKIRYMNYNGCARKFNVKKYIQKIESF